MGKLDGSSIFNANFKEVYGFLELFILKQKYFWSINNFEMFVFNMSN